MKTFTGDIEGSKKSQKATLKQKHPSNAVRNRAIEKMKETRGRISKSKGFGEK